MKRKLRYLVCFILTAAMIMSSLSLSAFADTDNAGAAEVIEAEAEYTAEADAEEVTEAAETEDAASEEAVEAGESEDAAAVEAVEEAAKDAEAEDAAAEDDAAAEAYEAEDAAAVETAEEAAEEESAEEAVEAAEAEDDAAEETAEDAEAEDKAEEAVVEAAETEEVADAETTVAEEASGEAGDGETGSELDATSQYKITYILKDEGMPDSFTVKNNSSNPVSYVYGTAIPAENFLAPVYTEGNGYTFVRWAYSNGSKFNGITANTEGDIELKAVWKEITYKIVFRGSGATSGSMESITGVKYSEKVPVPESGYTKTGYTFRGWCLNADGTGTIYKPGSTWSYLTGVQSEKITFHAVWKPITYKIICQDGTDFYKELTVKYGEEKLLPKKGVPVVTGYPFTWNTKKDGSGTSYEPASAVKNLADTQDAQIMLYAVRKPVSYQINFIGNGATGGATASVTGVKYDKTVRLTANGFTRTGYKFTGWNTKKDGSGTAYANKARVSNLAAKEGAVVKLYAQWQIISYKIVYFLNGGKNSADNPSYYDVKAATITLAAPTKTGYIFKGWYSDSEFTTRVKKVVRGSTGKVVLYAKWSPIRYTIAFDANGGTGTMSSLTNRAYGKTYTLLANKFKRAGYSFTGWNTKKNGSGTSFENKAQVTNLRKTDGSTVTLYAQWKIIKYTITYNLNGGTISSDANPKSYYVTTDTITLKNPTRKGFSFSGWYSDPGFTARIKSIPKGSTGDKTLYAKWTEHKYYIKFDGNGATKGSVKTMVLLYTEDAFLRTNGFKKKGYLFTEWNTKADGSGKKYKAREAVYSLTDKHKEVITLYAQWKPITYTIAFKANGIGSGSMASMTCKYDKKYTLSKCSFTKDAGKVFVSWNTQADGKGTSYKDGDTIKNLASENGKTISLYAQWKIPVTDLKLYGSSSATIGFPVQLTCTVNPSNTTDTLIYTSSNPKVATVDSKGLVTPLAAGTTTITLRASSGVKATKSITVIPNVGYWSVSYDVYDYTYGTPEVYGTKIYYSGTTLVLDTIIVNNRMFTADSFDYINISVYGKNDKLIAQKRFESVWIGIGKYSMRSMTFNFEATPLVDVSSGVYIKYDYHYNYTM